MAEPQYFCQVDRTVYGPYSFDDLAALARAGDIRPETLIRIGDDGRTWAPARHFDGLQFGKPVPPTTATPSGPRPRFEPPSYPGLATLSTLLMWAGSIAVVLSVVGLLLSLAVMVRSPSHAAGIAVLYIGGPLAAAMSFYVQAALISLAVDLARNSARQTRLLTQLLERTQAKE